MEIKATFEFMTQALKDMDGEVKRLRGQNTKLEDALHRVQESIQDPLQKDEIMGIIRGAVGHTPKRDRVISDQSREIEELKRENEALKREKKQQLYNLRIQTQILMEDMKKLGEENKALAQGRTTHATRLSNQVLDQKIQSLAQAVMHIDD